jgi:hypothetical protein
MKERLMFENLKDKTKKYRSKHEREDWMWYEEY